MKKEKIIAYEIYVQSFYDSNNDGIGDLNGITIKLNYLKKLGINLIWLTPIFLSPMNDNGYDIENYYKINPIYGDLNDLKKLIKKADELGIAVMLDMVFSHTSTKHEWFQKALKGNKEFQKLYFFKKEVGGMPPTNWVSKFGSSAWEYNKNLDKYYLHLFDKTQADLNWENEKIRKEVVKIMKYWLNLGVKGFRFDVINLISKPEVFKDSPHTEGKEFYTDGKKVSKYLKYLNKEVFSKNDCITVGELVSTSPKYALQYTAENDNQLNMAFTFYHLKVDYANNQKWNIQAPDLKKLKLLLKEWDQDINQKGGWTTNFFSNHDQPRQVSRFGDEGKYYYQSATAIALTYLLLRGTPFIYNGEEIGMTNVHYTEFADFKDVESKNEIEELKKLNLKKDEILKIVNHFSRDNARSPIQWNDSKNGGFSQKKPWMKVNPNFTKINVANNLKDKNSIFNFYQKVIALRKENVVFQTGKIKFDNLDPKVIAYTRFNNKENYTVIANWSKKIVKLSPDKCKKREIIINNYSNFNYKELLPFQGIVLKEI